MGRRLSDDFPYIGYVQVPPAVTGLNYDQNTQILTLHNGNGLDLTTGIPGTPGVGSVSYEAGVLTVGRVFSNGDTDYLTTSIPATVVTGVDTTPEALLTVSSSDDSSVSVQIPIPDDITNLSYSQSTGTLTLTTQSRYGVQAVTNYSTSIATATGFVGVTDVQPQSGSDNVGTKTYSNGGYILESCVANTAALRVYVLAVTGVTSYRPTVTVNGTAVSNLTRVGTTDTWTGYADITLSGSVITVVHSDGATDTMSVTQEATPVITNMVMAGAYPNVGQYEHAAGQTLSLTVTSSTQFVALDLVSSGSSAAVAQSTTFAATVSKTVTFTVANRGNTPTSYPVIARIQNANGTWSAATATNTFGATDGLYVIMLNNTQPALTFTTITYPVSQSALKAVESATVNVSETNVDTVSYTSPTSELTVTDPTTVGNKTVTRSSGAYNVSINNLTVTAGKTSNATTSTTSGVIKIADDAPVITITTPTRLRSGVTAQNHTVTIHSTQQLASAPSLAASVGTFTGSWVTSDSGVTWTRTLQIADSDTKGAATFSGLSATNLAGIVVSTITSGDTYTVGGFVLRTVAVTAWPNREAAIGTRVQDTSKLRVTNLSKGASGSLNSTYVANKVDAVDKFTITGPTGVFNATGTLLYNNDLSNAVSNTTTAYFEIEELI